MRKLALAVTMICAVAFLAGCASTYPVGSFYTSVKLPMDANGSKAALKNLKVGEAECRSYFALVAVGDASIEAAAKKAGITSIQYVDWHVENILGVIGKYKVVVYGE